MTQEELMNDRVTRRQMLQKMGHMGIVALAGGMLPLSWPLQSAYSAESGLPRVVVGKGGNLTGRLNAVLKGVGGLEHFVRKGSKVYIKPNIGWAREPEAAANTNPDLIFALINLCYAAGAKEVKIYENTCDNYAYCFQKSGIKDAVERSGGKLFAANNSSFFTTVDVPKGKTLKKVNVVKYAQEADCIINVPVAKHHSAAAFTLSMKNLMGIVEDRGYWHNAGLDQCIADFMTLVKPQLTIIDATRILTTGGPKGPGAVKEPGILIGSTDFVAADSYATTLFGKKGLDVPYIRIASQMGLGQADLNRISIVKV
jgi:uncharacterized protein (DUF362 family)